MKAGYQKVPEKHRHDATKKKDEEERWPHTEPGRLSGQLIPIFLGLSPVLTLKIPYPRKLQKMGVIVHPTTT